MAMNEIIKYTTEFVENFKPYFETKNDKPKTPNRTVTLICIIFPMKFKSKIRFLNFGDTYIAFAPYSPIRFGVNNDAVKAPKLCSKAFLNEIGSITLTKVCHFKV